MVSQMGHSCGTQRFDNQVLTVFAVGKISYRNLVNLL